MPEWRNKKNTFLMLFFLTACVFVRPAFCADPKDVPASASEKRVHAGEGNLLPSEPIVPFPPTDDFKKTGEGNTACGNGITDKAGEFVTEECDDGNKVDCDGCSNSCKITKNSGCPKIVCTEGVENEDTAECETGLIYDGAHMCVCSGACVLDTSKPC